MVLRISNYSQEQVDHVHATLSDIIQSNDADDVWEVIHAVSRSMSGCNWKYMCAIAHRVCYYDLTIFCEMENLKRLLMHADQEYDMCERYTRLLYN